MIDNYEEYDTEAELAHLKGVIMSFMSLRDVFGGLGKTLHENQRESHSHLYLSLAETMAVSANIGLAIYHDLEDVLGITDDEDATSTADSVMEYLGLLDKE